jgi:putative mRNA 3-end processing factor
MELLIESPEGLRCPSGGFALDPLLPVERAVITHAHGDHARPGSAAYLCHTDCEPLLRRRLGADARIQTAAYGERISLNGVTISLHPAGHMLGSAQVRIEHSKSGVWVCSGDYKREDDPTCPPFEPLRCETFITEATYALPIFRWDDPASVAAGILEWWSGNPGKASVLFCYALGKAQRLLAELARITDKTCFIHGALEIPCAVYRAAGIQLLPTRLIGDETRFAGELILAPITARGSPWMKRFGDCETAFASGLLRVRGTRRRRGFDRGFVISDHADFHGILKTVEETGCSRVLVAHGHRDALARYLREVRGLDARPVSLQREEDPEGD